MKTAIITGASSGLGLEAARVLAKQKDWHIVIAGRDPARNAQAVRRIGRGRARTRVDAMDLDLASLQSVRDFAAAIKARTDLPPIHALLNNAGLQFTSGDHRTADGMESTFQINHLGHFLLTNLLVDHMARPGRIIFTSSGTHIPGEAPGIPIPRYITAEQIAFPDRDPKHVTEAKGAAGRRRYSTSKLLNVLNTYELNRRLEALGMGADTGGLSVNAFDPGLMPGTGLARDYAGPVRLLWKTILPLLILLPGNQNSPRKSGKRLARLAYAPEYEGVTAQYFSQGKPKPSSDISYDTAKWADLWETSTRLSGLEETDASVLKAI